MQDHDNLEENTRLAAIDIGSNSIRLVVAQLESSGEYRILDDEREATQLARSLTSTAQLDRGAMDLSIATLRRFRKIAEGLGASQLRTIATCAVREAENGVEFLHRARDEAGLQVEVIDAYEEAQLAFLSVQRAFNIGDKNVVIVDIGGGSAEVILASGSHIDQIYNTSLGALRLSELYGPSRQLFGEDYHRMVMYIDEQLKQHVKKPAFAPHLLIGSGGTFTNLASMLIAASGQNQPEWGYRVSRAQLRHLLDRLQKMSVKQRRSEPGLSTDRAEIIVAGLAVIDRMMKRFKVNMLQVHTGGVRDGLLLRMIEELRPSPAAEVEDNGKRRQAVEAFAASCGVDVAHARHVSQLAGSIFQQICEPLQLDPNDRDILETAAFLQDVGYLINYDSHHKHSYQLIVNSRLPGYPRRELELIANVARYHRGAKPKRKHANFRRLTGEDQQRVRQMVAILRLASGLDRSHSQAIEGVDVSLEEAKAKFHLTSRSDPEVDLWAARRRAGLFEKVFNTEVSILPV